MEHIFTATIKKILKEHVGKHADSVFEQSEIIQYINAKTRSAHKGSKARSSFANLYALYVLIEDYIAGGFDKKAMYADYEGALFSKIFTRQRELAFGSKLQNHALNNRMNAEFQKYFPSSGHIPILRNLETNRYWINEHLLRINIGKTYINLAHAVIAIIDEYARTKQDAFERFVASCEEIQTLQTTNPQQAEDFIIGLLAPNIDARLFEIVSYAILKYFYHNQEIFWGFEINALNKENLKLYKTGRTNANDGGIDFLMKPLGRFFQVTETLDFKKYFLDIDKIQKYPITFVIKSTEPIEDILKKIHENASKTYAITSIVERYMQCIEEVINIPVLIERFSIAVQRGYCSHILEEIVAQSKVEFNYNAMSDEP